MPTKSVSTVQTATTARTVSDVLDIIEHSSPVSLKDTKQRIRRAAGVDKDLAAKTIKYIQSLEAALSSITSVPIALIKLMLDTNTYLGGLQATSYFYSICNVVDAPWDFYCSSVSGNPDKFEQSLESVTGSELVEATRTTDGGKRLHVYRRSINGATEPVTIRLFVSSDHPIASVLKLRNSHQQSAMSATGAICFWPKFLSKSPRQQFIVFESNPGAREYPLGQCKYRNKHSKLHPCKTMKSDRIKVFTDLSDAEIIMFENESGAESSKFQRAASELLSTVYAASNTSTRYLGSTHGM